MSSFVVCGGVGYSVGNCQRWQYRTTAAVVKALQKFERGRCPTCSRSKSASSVSTRTDAHRRKGVRHHLAFCFDYLELFEISGCLQATNYSALPRCAWCCRQCAWELQPMKTSLIPSTPLVCFVVQTDLDVTATNQCKVS